MGCGIQVLLSRILDPEDDFFQIQTSLNFLNSTFSRSNLIGIYGGSPIDTFSNVDPVKFRERGYGRFMCLNLLYNPFAPQFPGAPGLFFALRDHSRWPRARELVISRYGPHRWNYMGIYNIQKGAALSAQEFSSLDESVSYILLFPSLLSLTHWV